MVKAKRATTVILLAILSACLAYGLAACGGTAVEPVPKEQISADVQMRDAYLSEHDMKVTSFSISQRQTDTEGKLDSIQCTLTASNDELHLSYSAEYKVTYVLFNDSWTFEAYSKETSFIKPLHNPTKEDAETWLHEEIGSDERIRTHDAIILDTGVDVVYPFSVSRIERGVDKLYKCGILTYHFDASGWTAKKQMLSQSEYERLLIEAY